MSSLLRSGSAGRGSDPSYVLALDDAKAQEIYNNFDTYSPLEQRTLGSTLRNWAEQKVAQEQEQKFKELETIYEDVGAWWKESGGDPMDDEIVYGAANRKFIATQLGTTAREVGDLYPHERDKWFLQNFQKKPKDDTEAFNMIRESMASRKKVEEAYDMITGDVALALFDQIDKGQPVDVPLLINKWKTENADTVASLPEDWEVNTLKAAGEYFTDTERMLREQGPTLQKLYAHLVKATGRKVEGAPENDPQTVEEVNALLDELAKLPPEVRQRGYGAILMAAKRQGMDEKGFFEMAAEAWPRSLNAIKTLGFTAQETEIEERVRLLESGKTVYRDPLTGGLAGQSSAALMGASGQAVRQGEPVPEEERQQMLAEAKTELERFQVLREVRDLADNRFDPVRSNLKGGIGKIAQDIFLLGPQSFVYTGMAAIPVAGPLLSGAAIYSDEYNQLRLEGFTSQQSKALAAVSAPIQTFFEVAGAKLLFGRYQWYKDLVRKLVNPVRLKRFSQGGISFVGKVIGENITEGLQDLTTPLVKDFASALSEEIPDVNWEETLGQWYDSRLEVFAATLMPVVGGHTVELFTDGKRFSSAERREKLFYGPLGINQKEKRYIEDGTTPEERRQRSIEVLQAMPKERVKAAQNALAQQSQTAAVTQQDATTPTLEAQKDANGRVTYIVRDEGGKEVYRTNKQDAAEEAYILATAKSTAAQFSNDRMIVQELVSQWESADPNNVARTGQTENAQQVLDRLTAENNTAQIEILHRRIAQSPMAGTPYDQIQILGEATVEDVGNMVFRGVITLNESSRPQDAREEMHHVAVRRALGTNRVTLDQLREWLAASESVLETKLARDTQDDIVESLAIVQRAYEDGQIDAGRETQLPPSFVDYIKRMIAAFAEVLKRAVALREAFAAGALPQEYEAFLAETTGVSQQEVVDRARERTEQEVGAQQNYSIGQPELFRAGASPDDYSGTAPQVDWDKVDNYGTAWNEESVKAHTNSEHDFIYPAMLDASDLRANVVELQNAQDIRKMSEKELRENYPDEFLDEENIEDFDWRDVRDRLAQQEEQGWESLRYDEYSRPRGGGYPPLVVIRTGENTYDMVDGNHRLDTWQEQGFDVVPAWVVDDYLFEEHTKRQQTNYSIVRSVDHFKNDTRFDKLVKDGRVFTGVDVNDFIDQHILLHSPDNAFAGTIQLTDGNEIQGKGGVYYPAMYADKNYFWASTEAKIMATANHLNQIGAKNGGRVLMGLVSAPVEKLFSSTAMATGAVKFFNALTNDSRAGLRKSDLNAMLVAASKVEVVKKQKNKPDVIKKFKTTLKASDSYATNLAKINALLEPNNSIFEVRKAFVETLAAQVAKHLNVTPDSAKYVAGILADAENKHAKNQIKKGSLSKASIMQGLGNMLTEPFLRDFQEHGNGKIYAILEVQGEVKGIATTEHESYPATVVPVDKKSKVKLHVLKEAFDWQDVVGHQDGRYSTPSERTKLLPTGGMSVPKLKVLGVKAGSSAAPINYSILARYEGMPSVAVEGGRPYSPIVRDLLKRRAAGEDIPREVIDQAINKNFPAQLVEVPRSVAELPDRATIDDAIDKGQREKRIDVSTIEAGEKVAIRQDVPAMTRKGVGVVTVKSKAGNSYEAAVRITEPEFVLNEKKSLRIAMGEAKGPHIVINGKWAADQSMPADLETWTQVGYNPDRHSFYYDRATMQQVTGGSEAYQIGNTVFVKDAQYGDGQISDISYSISTQSEIDRVSAAMDRLARSPSERIAQYAALKERLAAALERNQPIMQSMRGDMLPQDLDRTRLLNDLGFLDYILKVLPPEVRGRVGGYTNLAGIAPVDVYKGQEKVSEAKNPAGAIISAWMREGLNIGQAQKKTELPEGYSTVANTTDERRDKTIANFLIDRLKKIDRELERYYKRDLMDQIFNVLDKSRPKAGESGVKRSTLGAETQKFADMVYRASLLDDEQTAERLAAIEAAITSTESSQDSQKRISELSEEWTIVNTFGDLKNRPSETMAYGLEWLQGQLKAGREAWNIKETARIEENRQRVADALVILGKPTDKGRFENPTALKRFLQNINALDLDHKSFEQFATIIFGDKLGGYFSEKLRQADISAAKAELENTKKILKALREGAKAAGMSTGKALVKYKREESNVIRKLEGRKVKNTEIAIDLAKKIVRGLADRGSLSKADVETLADELASLPRDTKKQYVTIKQVVYRGDETRISMNRATAMQLWLSWQQADIQEKMRREGWNDDSAQDLENLLSDPVSQAMLKVTRSIYGEGYSLTNPIYSRMFGMNMPMVKNYAPARFLNAKEIKDVGLDGTPLTAGGQPSFAKSRVTHSAKIANKDGLTVLQGHIAQQAHWVAFAELTREYRSLLSNPDVRDAITQRYGDDVLRTADMWAEQMEQRGGNKGREIAWINNMLGAAIGGQSVSLLGFNLKSLMMQTDNLMRFSLALDSRQIASALSDPAGLMRAIRKVWETDLLQTRLEGGATAETRFLFSRFVSMFRRGAKISELAMMPMNYVDSAGLSISGAIVYQAAYKDAIDSGMTEQMADQAAKDAVEAMIYRYGQPVLMGQKSNIENSGNVFAKTFFLFMSDPRLKTALLADSIRGLATGSGNWKDHVRRIVAVEMMAIVSHVLATAFRDATSDDDDEDLWSMGGFARALLLAPLQGYFLVGSVSEVVLSRLAEARWFTPTQNPFIRTADTAFKAFNNLDDAFNFDDPDALVKEWTNITRSIAVTPPLAAPAVALNLVRPLVQAWERMDDE